MVDRPAARFYWSKAEGLVLSEHDGAVTLRVDDCEHTLTAEAAEFLTEWLTNTSDVEAHQCSD